MKIIVLALLVVGCSREFKTGDNSSPLPHIKEPAPIALVKYGDTIYHCSSIREDECGIHAQCGKYELVCIKSEVEVQYL